MAVSSIPELGRSLKRDAGCWNVVSIREPAVPRPAARELAVNLVNHPVLLENRFVKAQFRVSDSLEMRLRMPPGQWRKKTAGDSSCLKSYFRVILSGNCGADLVEIQTVGIELLTA